MELNRRQTLTVLALATAATALPASSAMAVTLPSVSYPSYYPDVEGCATAWIYCQIPLVSVTATVLDQSGTAVAVIPMRRDLSESPASSRWTTGRLSTLPLGDYSMKYSATSQDGGTSHEVVPFTMRMELGYTVAATPSRISQANRTVTISGTAVGTHPVTRAVGPLAGLPLELTSRYTFDNLPNPPSATAITAADGSFTAQLTLGGAASIEVRTGTMPPGMFVSPRLTTVWVEVEKNHARITMSAAETHLNPGQSTTVQGLIEEEYASGQWRPLPASVLGVRYLPSGSGSVDDLPPVTSDSHGEFRFTVAPAVTARYYVSYGGGAFQSMSGETVEVFVRQPISFDDNRFVVRRTPDPNDGNMWEISGVVNTRRHSQDVAIQLGSGSGDDWRTISQVQANLPAGDGALSFRVPFRAPAGGQIRAYCPATDDTQPVASRTLLFLRTASGEKPQVVPGQQPPVRPRIGQPDRPTHR